MLAKVVVSQRFAWTYSTAFRNICILSANISSLTSPLVWCGWRKVAYAASGCGISPKTNPVGSQIPAMFLMLPLGHNGNGSVSSVIPFPGSVCGST